MQAVVSAEIRSACCVSEDGECGGIAWEYERRAVNIFVCPHNASTWLPVY